MKETLEEGCLTVACRVDGWAQVSRASEICREGTRGDPAIHDKKTTLEPISLC